jgi:hypothetical protein
MNNKRNVLLSSFGEGVTSDAIQNAIAEGRIRERERISGILSHKAAQGRAEFAQSLALTTDLDLEAVLKILAVSPKPGANVAGGNLLAQAMARFAPNPELGPGGMGDYYADDPKVLGKQIAEIANAEVTRRATPRPFDPKS